MTATLTEINQEIESQSKFVQNLANESQKVIVGQPQLLERLLIALLTGGHILLEGVPGLAKTLAIKTLAAMIDADFKRLQFTPDLLPADLLGTLIYDPVKQNFTPRLGPIFANFVLADEINRAPAKVQSALLEAMQEGQVTIGDQAHALPEPFLVMATQNPIEQEGTYTLPEAQVDRFLMKVVVGYPTKDDEKEIITRMTAESVPAVQKVVSTQDIINARKAVTKIYVDDKVRDYVLDVIFATRKPADYGLKGLEPLIAYGASPRASIGMIQAAKAHAFLQRRGFVTPEDIKAVGRDVLRHRVIPSFEAEAQSMGSDDILDQLLAEIDVP